MIHTCAILSDERLISLANRDKIHGYVRGGGTLLAHAADNGWPCTARWEESFLPRGVGHTVAFSNDLTITQPNHQVVAGLTDTSVDNWNYSSHGYLTNLPDSANVIVGEASNPANRPTYVEYSEQRGQVLATLMTLEWPGGNGPQMLRNEINYVL